MYASAQTQYTHTCMHNFLTAASILVSVWQRSVKFVLPMRGRNSDMVKKTSLKKICYTNRLLF